MPNCIGAIDEKHIDIQAVPDSSSYYYFNYKSRNSIVLIAMVDSNRWFTFVDIGCNGRVSDGGVYAQTKLCKYLEDPSNPLNIPQAKPGISGISLGPKDLFVLTTCVLHNHLLADIKETDVQSINTNGLDILVTVTGNSKCQ